MKNFIKLDITLIPERVKLFAKVNKTPPYEIHLLPNGKELELSGEMSFGITDATIKFLDANPAIKVIRLNIQGGTINEAYRLYRAIQKKYLTTYTSTDCVNACSIAFLAGKERYLGENGRLGFCSVPFDEMDKNTNKELNDEITKMLQADGVPDYFIHRALSTSPKNIWYPSKVELLEAKIIKLVIDGRYIGLTGITEWIDAHELESYIITSVPAYAGIAKHDPQNLAKFRKLLTDHINNKLPTIKTRGHLENFLIDITQKKIPKASDQMVFGFLRSELHYLKRLKEFNVQYCSDALLKGLININVESPITDKDRSVANAIGAEYSNSLARLIESVEKNPQEEYVPNSRDEANMKRIWIKIKRRYPWADKFVQNPSAFKNDPTSICRLGITYGSEILALPSVSQSAGVAKFIFHPAPPNN